MLASLPLIEDWGNTTVADVINISPGVKKLSDLQTVDPSVLVKDLPTGNPLTASLFPCLSSMFKRRTSNKHRQWSCPANFDENGNVVERKSAGGQKIEKAELVAFNKHVME